MDLTKFNQAAVAKKAFYDWHAKHGSQPYADICRDLENAEGVTQTGYAFEGAEYWQAALASANDARQTYIDER